ncbi:MAG: hypothetical protein KDA78_18420, partial [Planctomycetaceae bacterium]|nr:hypothetical protein [Planctomycetaceae bacterium]
LAGPLHAESLYSKPYQTENGKSEFRIRKQLHKLSAKEISSDQIIDPRIREIVQQKYAELGGKQPSQVFSDPANHPVMTAKSGRIIPIHKVRIRVSAGPRTIGKGERQRHVASGKDSNFASMIYAELDSKGKVKKWTHDIVTRLDAHLAYSSRHGNPGEKVLVPEETPTRQFLFSLCKNDCLLLQGPDGTDVLYRVQKLSQGEIQLCDHFLLSIGRDSKTKMDSRSPINQIRNIDNIRKRNARKVAVSPLGDIIVIWPQ